ncbi:DUF4097 family beta strand repeat-containing protein [Reichenbachiella faecimaris]|nr:DUF4097 family beta strand repeat-containing protein [Reichenbachiella faecimaris]
MKKLAYNLMIVVTLIGLLSGGLEGKDKGLDYEKSRKISKSYDVKSNVRLAIENSFGRVHINTWDQNKITVDIEIIARMNNESRAQDLLDKIEIDIEESSSEISFETRLGNLRNRDREEFEINYKVNMPKKNPLRLKNSFGGNYIGDLMGESDIDISYGDLKIEKLFGLTDIKISFSDGSIQLIKQGEIEIKYSDVEINELGVVRMEQGFSDVEVEKIGTIDLTSKYGDMEIGTVQGIKGYVGYSEFSIDRLEVELDMETSYSGDFTINEVAKGFSKILIDGKFGDYRISFEEGTNFTFDTELSFSDFSYSGLPLDFDYKVKEDFKSRYKGRMGSGQGGFIRIDTSYGDIRFR